MAYATKLLDPRWQRLRSRALDRDNWKCVRCNNGAITLHVHHKIYIYGLEPWDYDIVLLETLCKDCHAKEHKKEDQQQPVTPSRYSHLIDPKVETPADILNKKINELTIELTKENLTPGMETEIIKNIMYLQQKRKEYLNG